MDVKNLTSSIKKGQPINEVLSPENYVFSQKDIEQYYLSEKNYRGRYNHITKTQLRKYFNEFKSLYNFLSINKDVTKEEFDMNLKRVLIVLPIMKSQKTFTRNLENLIEEILKNIYETSKSNYKQAIEDYRRFINFYETLIAYSRDK